jgi:hypothetical protein
MCGCPVTANRSTRGSSRSRSNHAVPLVFVCGKLDLGTASPQLPDKALRVGERTAYEVFGTSGIEGLLVVVASKVTSACRGELGQKSSRCIATQVPLLVLPIAYDCVGTSHAGCR